MGSFPAKTRCIDIYATLGLDQLSSEEISNHGAPQVVSLLAIILEKFIKKNEKSLQSSRKNSLSITGFHGLRAPTLSVLHNAHYAKIGGVSTKEMNSLEMEFLFSLDFKLHVTLETFDHYCLQLKSFQIEQSIQVCERKGRWDIKDEFRCKPKLASYTCRAI
ncbi:hypothetical protein V2J09_007886 [Rumex salicifolius]